MEGKKEEIGFEIQLFKVKIACNVEPHTCGFIIFADYCQFCLQRTTCSVSGKVKSLPDLTILVGFQGQFCMQYYLHIKKNRLGNNDKIKLAITSKQRKVTNANKAMGEKNSGDTTKTF